MNRRIRLGARCRVIGRHTDNNDVVLGEGPNLGVEGVIVKHNGDAYPKLGNVWMLDAGSPKITTFWGGVAQQGGFSEHILEVIADDPPAQKSLNKELELTK
jgi:hypothetical protein